MTARKIVLIVAALALLGVHVLADTCSIDGGSAQQTMDGFGFSTAWSGRLSDAKNKALYSTLGMSWLRIRFDENGNFDDERANAAAAHAAGAKVFGTAWTAPPKWNSNGRSSGGYLLTQYYPQFADWLASAVKTVGVDMVSFINEPDFHGANGDSMTEPNMRMFLKNYSQALGKPILYPESYNFNDDMSDPALNDPEAADLISIIAGHIYGDGNRVHQNALDHGKHVWETENSMDGISDIGVCVKQAAQVTECLHNQFSAYFWWWVSDQNGPNENLCTQAGDITLMGYTLGQFARFIRPNAVRVEATYQPSSGVHVSAFTGDEFVVTAVNEGGAAVAQQFAVFNVTGLASLTVHRTDGAGHHLAEVGTVQVGDDGSFSVQLPAQSISTIHGKYSSAQWQL